MSELARYPTISRRRPSTHRLVNGGHGVTHEVAEGIRVGLHVRGHNLGMLAKVQLKGVAFPPAFGFDDLEWDTAE